MEGKRIFNVGLVVVVVVVMMLSAFGGLKAIKAQDEVPEIGLIYLENSESQVLLESLGVEVIDTYDDFVLAKLTPDQMRALKARGIESDIMADRTRISLNSYGFDTSLGEPAIPDNLRIAGYGPTEEGLYIVQFIGPVKKEWKDTVSGLGAAIHQYIPAYAFLMKMDDVTKAEVEALEFVQWVGIYQPAYKVSPRFEGVAGDVIAEILLFNGEKLHDAAVIIQNLGGSILFAQDGDIYGQIRAQINSAKIPDIANLNGVYFIEKSEQDYISNSQATWVVQTGVSGSRPIWDMGLHGENQIVCVQDTGIRITHEVFKDPEGDPVGSDHRKILDYYVPTGATGNAIDDHDHGTHVSCSVAGDAPTYDTYNLNDGNCYASANGCKIIMQDITNTGTGSVYPPPDLKDGFSAAYSGGAYIHTNSWGGGSGYTDDALEIDAYTWSNKNFTVLFAMGNGGSGANTISEQPEAKNAISVGGCQNGQLNPNAMYASSSRGYADDGRIKPTILAPGDDVTSATKGTDTEYKTWDGTSMATPQIAGQVAIVRQYFKEGWYPSGTKTAGNGFTPSAALIKAALVNGAKEITGAGAYTNGNRYPNGDQGWGRCTTSDVLYFSGDARKLDAADYGGLSTGQSREINVSVSDNTIPLEFTLVWTDYVGAASTTPELVNDLDLQVTDPGGKLYKGNAFGTSYTPGYSKADPVTADNFWAGTRTGGFDGKNVEEGVLLLTAQNAFPNGTYRVKIAGFNVPQGPQPYALVVTGGLGATSKGTIDIEKTIYPKESSVLIEVKDKDLNTDTGTKQTVDVNLKSDAETAGETVTLTETDVNTGIFRGTGTISGTNSAGVVLVNAADTITATYNDANDGTGSAATVTDTATVDGALPASPTGLTVKWWGAANQTLFDVDFSGTFPPAGWTVAGTAGSTQWKQSSTANAGGTSPEVNLHYGTSGTVSIWRLYAGPLNTTEMEKGDLVLKWNNYLNGYQSGCKVKIETSSDGTNWQDTTWVYDTASDIAKGLQTLSITTSDVGSSTFYVSFTVNGDSYKLDDWWVDNAKLSYTGNGENNDNRLNWTKSADDGAGANDVAKYVIYRADAQAGPWDTGHAITEVAKGISTYTDVKRGEFDGINWWYVVRAVDDAGNEDTNTVAVPETAVSDTPPTVTVNAPNGGESYPVDSTITITWTASDDKAWPATSCWIYYDTDTTPTGQTLITSAVAASAGTYDWDSTGVAAGDYYIHIVVEDSAAQPADDYSNNFFTITPTPPYAINLAGKAANSWVFVSFPSAMSGNIETILDDAAAGDNGTNWTVAKTYDNLNKKWLTYRVGSTTNTFTNIDNMMGVWLWITTNDGNQKLTLSSYTANSTVNVLINLYAGWNMVGYPTATSRAETTTLPTEADMVAVWQAATPYISDHAKGATVMDPGNAYWVRVTADCVWAVAP